MYLYLHMLILVRHPYPSSSPAVLACRLSLLSCKPYFLSHHNAPLMVPVARLLTRCHSLGMYLGMFLKYVFGLVFSYPSSRACSRLMVDVANDCCQLHRVRQSSCSSRPITILSAFRLSITLCPSALSFADAEIKAGSWLSTRIFSLTRTSWSLYLNVRSASSCAGARVPPSADAKVLRMLKPVSDELSPPCCGSRVRISSTRAASNTKRWKDTFGGRGGSKVCRTISVHSHHSYICSIPCRLRGSRTTAAGHLSTPSTPLVLPVCDHARAVVVRQRSLPLSYLRPR
jgi:hypothetical protein